MLSITYHRTQVLLSNSVDLMIVEFYQLYLQTGVLAMIQVKSWSHDENHYEAGAYELFHNLLKWTDVVSQG